MASHAVVVDEEEEPRSKIGSPGQRKDVADDDSGDLGYCFYILAFFSFLIVIVFFPFSLIWSVKIVKDYERAVILRLGRLVSKKAKGPGIFFVLPCIDDVRVINLRTVTFDVPPQEILTKDSVTCRVDAVVYFRISDPIKSVISVENALNSTYLRAQTTLRNILGTKNLKDILSERDIIRAEMSVS
jgi:erythrocyte band 7 integral membrane protein